MTPGSAADQQGAGSSRGHCCFDMFEQLENQKLKPKAVFVLDYFHTLICATSQRIDQRPGRRNWLWLPIFDRLALKA